MVNRENVSGHVTTTKKVSKLSHRFIDELVNQKYDRYLQKANEMRRNGLLKQLQISQLA